MAAIRIVRSKMGIWIEDALPPHTLHHLDSEWIVLCKDEDGGFIFFVLALQCFPKEKLWRAFGAASRNLAEL